MIHSMTGFGEARAESEGVTYRVEIRSLNNRYFKASIKLPERFQRYETQVDKQLRSRLGRGSVSFTLRMRDENPAAAYQINTAILGEYLRQLRSVAGEDKSVTIDLARLVDVPGVFQPPDIEDEVIMQQFATIESLTTEALDQLIAMRSVEGLALLADLEASCKEVRSRIAEVRQHAPGVVVEYQKRLQSRVQQLLDGTDGSAVELFQDAVSREVAIFAERCDVNEEVSRIDSHLDQFATLCAGPETVGRKLDFLTQELLREANTIGSKSNSAAISRHVVEIKAAVDRIKEQVQNVE